MFIWPEHLLSHEAFGCWVKGCQLHGVGKRVAHLKQQLLVGEKLPFIPNNNILIDLGEGQRLIQVLISQTGVKESNYLSLKVLSHLEVEGLSLGNSTCSCEDHNNPVQFPKLNRSTSIHQRVLLTNLISQQEEFLLISKLDHFFHRFSALNLTWIQNDPRKNRIHLHRRTYVGEDELLTFGLPAGFPGLVMYTATGLQIPFADSSARCSSSTRSSQPSSSLRW